MMNKLRNLFKDYIWDTDMNYKNHYGNVNDKSDDNSKLRRITIVGRDMIKARIASIVIALLALNMIIETLTTNMPIIIGLILTGSLILIAYDMHINVSYLKIFKEQAICSYKYGNAYYGNFINIKADAVRRSMFVHPARIFDDED